VADGRFWHDVSRCTREMDSTQGRNTCDCFPIRSNRDVCSCNAGREQMTFGSDASDRGADQVDRLTVSPNAGVKRES